MAFELRTRRVVVLGLDGLDPKTTERLLEAGELPHLAKLRGMGAYRRLATTYPAQTPVAWSTFATGTNPGGHGIFDFLRRDPDTYLPDIALNRYEPASRFLPPKVVNLRRGTPIWELLTRAGVESTILRCPCTYPPDKLRGRMLSGLGVPDIRGGFGTPTLFTADADSRAGESEQLVVVAPQNRGAIAVRLAGPRRPGQGDDASAKLTIDRDPAGRRVLIRAGGRGGVEARERQWSEWLKVRFRTGRLQSVSGLVRFYLKEAGSATELYASPVNFDPRKPMFPISHPWDYAGEIAREIGTYYTAGMVEDHTGLNNGRIDEAAFLAQCEEVMRERESMLYYALEGFEEGLLFCLFDTPDRVQHMFWRFTEPEHPANGGELPPTDLAQVIDKHYQACDDVVGRLVEAMGSETLLIVLSDHGFSSFRRGIHLNTWLYDNGFLVLKKGLVPGPECGDFLRKVDWRRTRAYALGLGGIYLNRAGREGQGIVSDDDAPAVMTEISSKLGGLIDEEGGGAVAVRSVLASESLYRGPYASEAPDLVVNCGRGYRASWGTTMGEVPAGLFEPNLRRWSGDHVVDPMLVPGVLFANHPGIREGARMVDLAPSILRALGVPPGEDMEGRSLW